MRNVFQEDTSGLPHDIQSSFVEQMDVIEKYLLIGHCPLGLVIPRVNKIKLEFELYFWSLKKAIL